jgi:hypothetical protein
VVGLNQEEGHASPIEELSQIPESQLEEDVGSTFCNQFKGVAYKFWQCCSQSELSKRSAICVTGTFGALS